MSGIAFAELVIYIEVTHLEASTAPVIKLTDLVHLYSSQLGVMSDVGVNSTRLKQRLLVQFLDMKLVFDEDV